MRYALLFLAFLLSSCGTVRNVVKHFSRTDSLSIRQEKVQVQTDIKAFRTIEEFTFSEREFLPENWPKKDSAKIITTTVYEKDKKGTYKKTTEYLSDNSRRKEETQTKDRVIRVQREVVKEVPPGYFVALSLGIFWLTILTIYLIYRHFFD